jgi:hypothetical protein
MNYEHPAWLEANRKARDRGRSHDHERGICGGMGSLCSACYADELRAFSEWAADKPDPVESETASEYWRRIGGPFGDAWYEVAHRRFGAVRK